MKIIFLFSLLFMNLSVISQVSLRAPTVALSALSGTAHAFAEVWSFNHPQSIFNGSPETSFWGLKSWKRKYKNFPYDKREAFFGSKTIFVFTTDGYHLARMINRTSLLGISLTYDRPNKWVYYVIDFLIVSVTYSLSFTITKKILIR